jgi:hypothetical protein
MVTEKTLTRGPSKRMRAEKNVKNILKQSLEEKKSTLAMRSGRDKGRGKMVS